MMCRHVTKERRLSKIFFQQPFPRKTKKKDERVKNIKFEDFEIRCQTANLARKSKAHKIYIIQRESEKNYQRYLSAQCLTIVIMSQE